MNNVNVLKISLLILGIASYSCAENIKKKGWVIDFKDEFEFFNDKNWQDQLLWVNDEDHFYVRDGEYNTRKVSNGSLKLRLVKLDYERSFSSNVSKFGKHHPETKYAFGRLTSKNLQEFTGGRWTAKIKLNSAGQEGMFPAWWILGARNNKSPVKEDDENICWPLPGSSEIDIMGHHGTHGGQIGYVGRSILPLGTCDNGGDWRTNQVNLLSNLIEYMSLLNIQLNG